jgi:hypothetical protein
LAEKLGEYGVVNVGATGLFVARRITSLTAFRRDLLAALPFETEVAWCDGRDLLEIVAADPFAGQATEPDFVPFVSVAIEPIGGVPKSMPIDIPANGEWYVRILGRRKQFLFGLYRRHMKTIGYLGRIDAAVKTRVTTRKWSTILLAARHLQDAAG